MPHRGEVTDRLIRAAIPVEDGPTLSVTDAQTVTAPSHGGGTTVHMGTSGILPPLATQPARHPASYGTPEPAGEGPHPRAHVDRLQRTNSQTAHVVQVLRVARDQRHAVIQRGDHGQRLGNAKRKLTNDPSPSFRETVRGLATRGLFRCSRRATPMASPERGIEPRAAGPFRCVGQRPRRVRTAITDLSSPLPVIESPVVSAQRPTGSSGLDQ